MEASAHMRSGTFTPPRKAIRRGRREYATRPNHYAAMAVENGRGKVVELMGERGKERQDCTPAASFHL